MEKQALRNKGKACLQPCPALLLLYLHFLPDAFAAQVLGFVEVVCSEAA